MPVAWSVSVQALTGHCAGRGLGESGVCVAAIRDCGDADGLRGSAEYCACADSVSRAAIPCASSVQDILIYN